MDVVRLAAALVAVAVAAAVAVWLHQLPRRFWATSTKTMIVRPVVGQELKTFIRACSTNKTGLCKYQQLVPKYGPPVPKHVTAMHLSHRSWPDPAAVFVVIGGLAGGALLLTVGRTNVAP